MDNDRVLSADNVTAVQLGICCYALDVPSILAVFVLVFGGAMVLFFVATTKSIALRTGISVHFIRKLCDSMKIRSVWIEGFLRVTLKWICHRIV